MHFFVKIIMLININRTIAKEPPCYDNPMYISMEAAPCSAFSGLDCTQMEAFGWDRNSKIRLIRNCPLSCSLCPSSSPTSSPTPLCHDDTNYTIRRGFPCERFKGLDCFHLIDQGFFLDDAEGHEVLRRCSLSCGICDMLTPSASPSASCFDQPYYRNRLGLACENFEGLSCHKSSVLGLTMKEVRVLQASCPEACGECFTSHPSKVPSFGPSKVPSIEPSLSPTPACYDVPSYVDPFLGLQCQKYKKMGVECKLMKSIFNEKQFKALIENCASSCGVCDSVSPSSVPSITPSSFSHAYQCKDNPYFKDGKNNFPCSSYRGLQCELLSYVGWKKIHLYELLSNCPETCGHCHKDTSSLSPTKYPTFSPTESCFDRPGFRDPKKGLECKVYDGIDCTRLTLVGWSNADLNSLLQNCAKSCGMCS